MYERTTEMTIEEYIDQKIDMLIYDFKIRLTESEIKYMKTLKTEIAVDNFAHDLFDRIPQGKRR